MLELRIMNRVDPYSAPVAFVESTEASVDKNVVVIDKASENAANSNRFYGGEEYVVAFPSTGKTIAADTPLSKEIVSDEFVVGNRSVLSKDILVGKNLFFRSFLGKGAVIELVSDSGSVNVTVSGTQVSYNSTVITWTNKSTRQVVKEINDAADGITAVLIEAVESNFEADTLSVTTSGVKMYQDDYHRLYAPNASTSDLDLAREVIKPQIELFIDGKKSNEMAWDIEVEAYETNGFLVSLYLERRSVKDQTVEVRFNAISQASVVQQGRTEVCNAEPYLRVGTHFTLVEQIPIWKIEDLSSDLYKWGIGLFSKTGASQSVTVDSTTLTFPGSVSITYTNKEIADLVAEIRETVGTTFEATLLAGNLGTLVSGSLFSDTYSVKPAGTPVKLNKALSLVYSPDKRMAALKPYTESMLHPWYPRIQTGSFSEYLPVDNSAYGSNYGRSYGGVTADLYRYSIPEFDTDLAFDASLGSPWRQRALEEPTIINEKVLRTQRFPLESLANLVLYDGDVDISSSIRAVDLTEGFIYLSAKLDSYDDLGVAYTYNEKSLPYTDVDLNPIDNPGLVGKFICVYAIPTQIGEVIWSGSKGIYHIIGDTVAEVDAALAGLTFDSSSILVHPVQLGIYYVNTTEGVDDVSLVPIPITGGGLKQDVPLSEEGLFCWDVGRWDGEPFESKGGVVTYVPSDMIGTSDTNFVYDAQNSDSTFMSYAERFSRQDIRENVERWLAAGHGTVIEEDPDVSTI